MPASDLFMLEKIFEFTGGAETQRPEEFIQSDFVIRRNIRPYLLTPSKLCASASPVLRNSELRFMLSTHRRWSCHAH